MQKINNFINLLWSAIWHSFLFGGSLHLLIAIVASLMTSGLAGLIFFVPTGFIVGLTYASINLLLLLILAKISCLFSSNKLLKKLLFTFSGAVFGAVFGAVTMFLLVEDSKMLGGMVNTLSRASSLITAISYGITNYRFACWHQSRMR
ncbi:MAG: hypothetical protein KI793_10060 [Rivularia sp. (in: Bacteria)]|nr:hypothetical protein [Rivularia sp. MS3]